MSAVSDRTYWDWIEIVCGDKPVRRGCGVIKQLPARITEKGDSIRGVRLLCERKSRTRVYRRENTLILSISELVFRLFKSIELNEKDPIVKGRDLRGSRKPAPMRVKRFRVNRLRKLVDIVRLRTSFYVIHLEGRRWSTPRLKRRGEEHQPIRLPKKLGYLWS